MKNSKKNLGTLVIIGGHEDKEGECAILKEVAKHIKDGSLVIATVASKEPEDYFTDYQEAFARLGITNLTHLYIQDRAETTDEAKMKQLDNVNGIFFSGGDQLRISSQIGDTPFETRIHEIYKSGGIIAGTSAGASVMGETMLIRGPNSESHRIGDLHLAPGLRLIRNVIIDQHFAERGRIGRLLGAVALNPRILGIGIDENTAIVVKDREFSVLGKGAVYVVEGASVTYSNIAEAENKRTLSMFDVRLHILSQGDSFSLKKRRPISAGNLEKSIILEKQATDIKISKRKSRKASSKE
ncbi:MAG: cyanophycinase [Rickettsiaceae bacterium]|jgi:cyanophycinase|nr:cyanophycinase [Rickettsiaceae bacterium]